MRDSILIHYTLILHLTILLKVSILYVFLIYLGSMSVITMKSNLNLQGLLHHGDRKFASAKSSVTDSSSRNFQYLTKKSRLQNYLAILAQRIFPSTVVNNQTKTVTAYSWNQIYFIKLQRRFFCFFCFILE